MNGNNNNARGKEGGERERTRGGGNPSKGFGRGSRTLEEKKQNNPLKPKDSNSLSQQTNPSSSSSSSISNSHSKKINKDQNRGEKERKEKKENKIVGLEEEKCLWKEKMVPRFSIHYTEEIDFIPFLLNQKYRKKEEEGMEREEAFDFVTMQEMIQNINLDLSKLLKMDFKSFWCQVGFDSSFLTFYDSFLRYAPRSYESVSSPLLSLNEDSIQSIFRRVFGIILRMSKHQESPSQFFSREFHSNFIYEKKIFDIPKLMDISLLFGGCNSQILTEIVQSLFERQPKYWNDLTTSFQQTIQSLSQTIQDLNKQDRINSDQLDYLVDILASLSSFIVIFPQSCRILGLNHSNLFQNLIPQIMEYISKLQKEREKEKDIISQYCINLSCSLLEYFYFHLALNRLSSKVERKEGITRIFEALEILTQFPSSLLHPISNSLLVQTKLHEMKYESSDMNSSDVSKIDYFLGILERISGKFSPPSSSFNFDEKFPLIQQVKSLLPDLGEGFIEACLDSFGNDPEIVINRIFEDNLPPHLMELDRSKPREISKTSLISSRKNIYSGDEFDIMAGSSSNVKVLPKREEITQSLQMDRSDLESLKSKFEEYIYEDEYDDALDNFEGNFEISAEQTNDQSVSIIDNPKDSEPKDDDEEDNDEEGEKSSVVPTSSNRGRGKGYKAKNHNRKDQSSKKRGGGMF